MSGHSKWATIKRKKGALDAKRGTMFTKAAKEVTIAAREGGGNPDMNARLRAAITAAKAVNVPNANIERAIKRGTGEIEGAAIEEVAYEGYGPGGVAVYVLAATDNRNRTYPEIRKLFEKSGGSLGSSGSVAFMFEKRGVISLDGTAATEEQLMEVAVEAGADDIREQDGQWEVVTPPQAFHVVLRALEEAGLSPSASELAMVPTTTTRVEGKTAEQVLRLLEWLDEHDDVQHVWANFDIDDDTLAAQAG